MAQKKLVDYSFTSPNVTIPCGGRQLVDYPLSTSKNTPARPNPKSKLVPYTPTSSSSSSATTNSSDSEAAALASPRPSSSSGLRARSSSFPDFGTFCRSLFYSSTATTDDTPTMTAMAIGGLQGMSPTPTAESISRPGSPCSTIDGRRMTPFRACKATPRVPWSAAPEMTPIPFKGTRVHRRIIRSPSVDQLLSPSKRDEQQSGKKTKARTKKKVRINAAKKEREQEQENSLTPLRRPKAKKHKVEEGEEEKSEENEEQETETTATLGAQNIKKKKRWTAAEVQKLKIALKFAVNPTTDEHWEHISRSLGGNRSVEECREQAIKMNWKSPFAEEQLQEKNKLKSDQQPTTSNFSTLSFEAAAKKRQSRRSFDCDNQFFKENVDLSLASLNLDDSMLTAALTPPEQTKCARRPFLLRPIDYHEANRQLNSSDDSSEDY